jgi:hypothetical protein
MFGRLCYMVEVIKIIDYFFAISYSFLYKSLDTSQLSDCLVGVLLNLTGPTGRTDKTGYK